MKFRSDRIFVIGLIAITATSALASGNFNRTGSMNVARESHTSTLLSNGQVLVAGGGDGLIGYLSSAELYNPATGTWALTGSMSGRARITKQCGCRMVKCSLPAAITQAAP